MNSELEWTFSADARPLDTKTCRAGGRSHAGHYCCVSGFACESFSVHLSDGRCVRMRLRQFPKPLAATPRQRRAARTTRNGLHWDDFDGAVGITGAAA
ncbi:DUF2442 domain-containing protein [Burkholderia gladioli]|uniref:DUF2442 domain-containing protein n=1 Tax=Burkholderia gladioli TaxID=28095 RepID=UPI003B67AB65